MGRTVIVGDVHGCADELDELFDRVALVRDDRLVSVGDIINRGPKPREAIALMREHGARVVLGNHEDRLLECRRRGEPPKNPVNLRTFEALADDDWAYLESLPLWLTLAEHEVLVVHAGLVAGVPLEKQDPRHLVTMRSLLDDGTPTHERDRGVWWGANWQGPPHVVFGHNAQSEPQLHPWATGLDTGCVYGGKLTALVLSDGAPVAPPDERRAALVSVPARRAYVPAI